MWHDHRPPDAARAGSGSCLHALRVPDVIRMVSALDAITDAHVRLTRQRRPLGRRIVEDILAWPVLPVQFADVIRAELNRDGQLWTDRARQLVTRTLDDAMRQSELRASVTWAPQRRPELALVAGTTVALYIADVLAHVGAVDVDRSYVCRVCGQPFTPKRAPRPGDGLYCRRPECQRVRERSKQRAYRDRRKES